MDSRARTAFRAPVREGLSLLRAGSLGALLAAQLAGCDGVDRVPSSPAAELRPGAITGRVSAAAEGAPLAGAIVSVAGGLSATTDGVGRYEIRDVAPGSYAVTATREGFAPASSTVIVGGGRDAAADFQLATVPPGAPLEGAVTGRVLFGDGRPAPAGAAVRLLPGGPHCGVQGGTAAETDEAGRFLAQGLAPGLYLVCAETLSGGRSAQARRGVSVEAGGLATADLILAELPLPSGPPQAFPPPTVSLGDVFAFTFTVVGDGFGASRDVIVADTLPLLDDPGGPATPADRDGGQAFRYVTDRPTFDPEAIRYYVDQADDAGGTGADVCLQAPDPGLPPAFTTPAVAALCGSFQGFATVGEARRAAEAASEDGDQIVIVEYFVPDLLDRTPPSGDLEAEDSFEIRLEAIHSVNELRLDDGRIPERGEENGEWCNVVTATSAENDFVFEIACTRVVEALLEVRKTASDAVVPAGGQLAFELALGNLGSEALGEVVVVDTLDAAFLARPEGDPGLVRIDGLCAGCEATLGPDSSVIAIRVPAVPPTDLDADGVFDDAEGFVVATLVARTPLAAGPLCNRVTATDTRGRRDSDISCVVAEVRVELDVANDDGRLVDGAFDDVESFVVGDSVAYRTLITNLSAAPATSLTVTWEIAPSTGILQLVRVLAAEPAAVACDLGSDTCSVILPSLEPGESLALDYLAVAAFPGDDVNRMRLSASELGGTIVNEEPTTVDP